MSGWLQSIFAHSSASFWATVLPVRLAGGLTSLTGIWFGTTSYGVRSGLSAKHENIGFAVRSNRVIGGIPRTCPIVVAIETCVTRSSIVVCEREYGEMQ